jgi:hypothetical protein
MRLISFAMPSLPVAVPRPNRVGFGLTEEELRLLNNPLPRLNMPGDQQTEFWYKQGVAGIDEEDIAREREEKIKRDEQYRENGTSGKNNDRKWK